MNNCIPRKDVDDKMDIIYCTRKCRINAAERYKFLDQLLLAINTYYSAFLIILSVIFLLNSNPIGIGIMLISLSILTFTFNAICMSLQFKDRYYSFKANYIELGALYNELKLIDCDADNSRSIFEEITKKYDLLLNMCENHTTYDYYKFLINDHNALDKKFAYIEDQKLKKSSIDGIKKYYYYRLILKFIFFALLVSVPFITPYLVNIIKIFILNAY
ncbi:SLATT domain-containing protein [Anoxybacterium hadale]|uniref:SLATT domain-containing protein n=1 Tax=Anoxybacterium hadale TaxID=3408580 RepID=A0ACD1ACS3_9FIRM|nr:SLATT domain-containing protein [Clostridiales bacterium]